MSLLTVPNVSEGRDRKSVERLGDALVAGGVELLDTHSDPIHNRSVFTSNGEAAAHVGAMAALAEAALDAIDMREHAGAHPCVGALDVAPVVWLDAGAVEPARAVARQVGATLAELAIPVFFYGQLASSPERTERSFFRSGGIGKLRERMKDGLAPDLGPLALHPTAGATLVTARAPIAAFNLALDTDELGAARLIASQLRESGGGLPGVRAIGIEMRDGTVQVSTNIHDPLRVHLAEVVERVRALAAPHGLTPTSAEIVGLVPRATLEEFPADLPLPGFDPTRHVIEARIEASG